MAALGFSGAAIFFLSAAAVLNAAATTAALFPPFYSGAHRQAKENRHHGDDQNINPLEHKIYPLKADGSGDFPHTQNGLGHHLV